MEDAKIILNNYGLYITRSRLMILEAVLRCPPVFDHTDLMAACKEKIDRVTIWRALQLFYDCKILLKVPSTDNVIRYAFRGIKPKGKPPKHMSRKNSHLQLICQDCGKIISVDNFKFPIGSLPVVEFEPLYIDMIINGKCSSCSNKVK
jgi:Fe2+ or Zn2+ uptake regulation protein